MRYTDAADICNIILGEPRRGGSITIIAMGTEITSHISLLTVGRAAFVAGSGSKVLGGCCETVFGCRDGAFLVGLGGAVLVATNGAVFGG